MRRIGWVAIAMLVVWAVGTLRGWPGWVHALLTGGVFLLIYSIVRSGDQRSG